MSPNVTQTKTQYFPSLFSCILRLHLSLNREGRWGTTDDFATSFLHFSLFSTALWDLANSRLVHALMLSSQLFFWFALSSPFHRALHCDLTILLNTNNKPDCNVVTKLEKLGSVEQS